VIVLAPEGIRHVEPSPVMQENVASCIQLWHRVHMRTTISIAEDLLAKAQQLTGKTGYSDAIVTSLRDYVALRERLALLERLYSRRVPHSRAAIKRARRRGRWSS